jgi:hypothetical protein
MGWPNLPADITGRVDQELLQRNEYAREPHPAPKSTVGCNRQTERNPLWPRLPAAWDARWRPKSPSSLDPMPILR